LKLSPHQDEVLAVKIEVDTNALLKSAGRFL